MNAPLNASHLRLYLITDDTGRKPDALARIVEQAIQGGVTAVQFREKSAAAEVNEESFARLKTICAPHGIPLLLNADLLGAFVGWDAHDGVHYNTRTLPMHPHAVLQPAGYSAHSIDEVVAASSHPVTFSVLSCIFDSPGKTERHPALGLRQLERVRRALPGALLLALGGVNVRNAAECIRSGADGIAVIRAIFSQRDPSAAAQKLRAQVEQSLESR